MQQMPNKQNVAINLQIPRRPQQNWLAQILGNQELSKFMRLLWLSTITRTAAVWKKLSIWIKDPLSLWMLKKKAIFTNWQKKKRRSFYINKPSQEECSYA